MLSYQRETEEAAGSRAVAGERLLKVLEPWGCAALVTPFLHLCARLQPLPRSRGGQRDSEPGAVPTFPVGTRQLFLVHLPPACSEVS